jgi:hypothetical protein
MKEMTPAIPNLHFNAAGDDTQHHVHKCAQSDGDHNCLYGTILPPLTFDDHTNYFGYDVRNFGENGCPNLGCLDDKKSLEHKIKLVRESLNELDAELRKAKNESDKKKIEQQIKDENLLLVGDKARYNALPCVIHGICYDCMIFN